MRDDIMSRLMAKVGPVAPDSPAARVKHLGEVETVYLARQEEHSALLASHERRGFGQADLEGTCAALEAKLAAAQRSGESLGEQEAQHQAKIAAQAEEIAAAAAKAQGLAAELEAVRAQLAAV